MKRKVEVIAYNPEWKAEFETEAEKIREIFKEHLSPVHHIGSTSVPGLAAKPVIDIILELENIQAADELKTEMEKLGYEARGENGIEGRRFFMKGGNHRTHHVHAFQKGSSHVYRHFAFRDYLKAHPETARAYGQLKLSLAGRYPQDIESYIKGKEDFITDIEQKALEWTKSKYSN